MLNKLPCRKFRRRADNRAASLWKQRTRKTKIYIV
jgi:hypothetical protein